jgi:hypothetical protein
MGGVYISVFDNKGLTAGVYLHISKQRTYGHGIYLQTPSLETKTHGTIVRQCGEIICEDSDRGAKGPREQEISGLAAVWA